MLETSYRLFFTIILKKDGLCNRPTRSLHARHLLFDQKQETGREYKPHPHHLLLREARNSEGHLTIPTRVFIVSPSRAFIRDDSTKAFRDSPCLTRLKLVALALQEAKHIKVYMLPFSVLCSSFCGIHNTEDEDYLSHPLPFLFQ